MLDTLAPLIKKFLPFAQERMGFDRPPRLFLKNDSNNASNPLGRTAYYDPSQKSVTLYVTGRHPKDVMRSLSHELVHHTQNCRGDFDSVGEMGEGYAQNDSHLREMEREAYEVGNMCFRDWEDSVKSTIYYEHLQKGENQMSTKDWKNGELTTVLSEAFGFKFSLNKLNEGADKNTGMSGVKGDDDDDTYMGHVKEEEELEELESVAALSEVEWRPTDVPRGRSGPAPERGPDDYSEKFGSVRDRAAIDDAYYECLQANGGIDSDAARVKCDAELKEAIKEELEEGCGDDDLSEDSGAEEGEHYRDNEMHDEDHIKAIEHHLDALKRDRDYDEEHIDEGGAAARTGNEEKDQGRDRMHADRVHENDDATVTDAKNALKEAILGILQKHF